MLYFCYWNSSNFPPNFVSVTYKVINLLFPWCIIDMEFPVFTGQNIHYAYLIKAGFTLGEGKSNQHIVFYRVNIFWMNLYYLCHNKTILIYTKKISSISKQISLLLLNVAVIDIIYQYEIKCDTSINRSLN